MFRASLNIRLASHEVDYGDQIRGEGMIFTGEPMVVDIGLVSRLDGPPVAAEHDWFQRITATLYPGGRFEFERAKGVPFTCAPESTRTNQVVNEAARVVIGAHGWIYVRCRTDLAEYNLTPGLYTLEVAWSNAADMMRFTKKNEIETGPSYLTGLLPFELRAVVSEGDRLDLLNHLAARAETDGRLEEALRLTDQGLARNPANVTAWLTRVRVHGAQGLCALASLDLQKAAETIQLGRDTSNRRLQRRDPAARPPTAEEIRRSMPGLPCP